MIILSYLFSCLAINRLQPTISKTTSRLLPGYQRCALAALLRDSGSACASWTSSSAALTIFPPATSALVRTFPPDREKPRMQGFGLGVRSADPSVESCSISGVKASEVAFDISDVGSETRKTPRALTRTVSMSEGHI